MSFVNFVLSFRDDNTPWGDLARDMLEDTSLNRRFGYKKFKSYLQNYGADDVVLELLDELRTAYDSLPKGTKDYLKKCDEFESS